MKNSQKITRHVIETVEDPPFIFLGIVSSEPDYRLSVILNKLTGLSFRHGGEVKDNRMENPTGFSKFITTPLSFSLICNKAQGIFLLKKLKNIDFFLVFNEKTQPAEAAAMAATIRTSPEITAVFVFNSTEVNDKNIGLLAR